MGHGVRTRLDAQLEVRAAVRREAGGRAPEHVPEFSGEGCKLRGVAPPVGREREDRALNGEGDAADEVLCAVSERE